MNTKYKNISCNKFSCSLICSQFRKFELLTIYLCNILTNSMKYYFTSDTITNILNFLNKDDSFNFLNIALFLQQHKTILYGKYYFKHDNIKNDKIAEHIKHLKIPTTRYLSQYKNLNSLTLSHCRFNKPIHGLPNTLKSLVRKSI